jgi:Bacteriophage Mu Gam like protein
MAKNKTITTPTKRPEALGAKPKLKTLSDIDAALKELAWCRQRQAVISSEVDEQCAAVNKKCEPQRRLTIDGTETTLADRASRLDELLRDWASEHLAEHLTDGKTLTLDHGTLSQRALPVSVGFLAGEDQQSVMVKLDQAAAWSTWIRGFLVRAFGGLSSLIKGARHRLLNEDFLKVEVSLSKQAILKTYKDGKVSADGLAKFGLTINEGAVTYDVKVA